MFTHSLILLSDSFLNRERVLPFEYRPHIFPDLDWVFLISLLLLFLLAFIKLNLRTFFTLFYRELMKGKQRVYSNTVLQTRFSSFLFVICTCIVFSLAFYVYSSQLYNKNDILIFLFAFILITIFFLFRLFLSKIVGFLFDIKNIISEWETLTAVLNFVSAVLCFPLIFIAYYYSFSLFWTLALAIFIAVFLYRLGRGWIIFRKKTKIYEYFLYFCTVEILPLLIFFKFVISRLSLF